MAIEYRVKVNLTSGEIEVSGDRKFVDQKLKDLPVLLESLRKPAQPAAASAAVEEKPAARKRGRKAGKTAKAKVVKATPAESAAKPAEAKAKPTVRKAAKRGVVKARPVAAKTPVKIDASDFKAEYKKYPKKLSQNDAVLLSGLVTQKAASDRKFTSADVDYLLNTVGKKISNTSVSLSQLRVGKKIERVGKTGRIVHYRVTPAGEERLQKALAKA